MTTRMDRRTFLESAAVGATFTLVAPQLVRAQTASIKIGLLVPLTGAAGAYGPAMAKAGKVTADSINKEAGGVLGGRKLEVLVEDTESNATAGVNAARKLLDVDGVVALCGVWNSPVAMALRPIVLERNMLMMVSGSADQITAGDTKGLIWRFQAKGADWGPTIARAMLKSGAKKVSVLGLQNPFTVSMVDPFANEIKKGGGSIVDTVFYNPGQPSYRAEVEKVFGRKPDAVFMPALLPDFSAIAKEVYRSGFESKIFTLSIAADSEGKFIQNVGADVAEGINHLQPTPPASSPAYKRFLRLMGEPDGRIFLFACNTYDQIAMLAMIMEKAKSTNAVEIAKQIMPLSNGPGESVDDPARALQLIRDGKPINYTGAGSDVDFTASGDLTNREFTHYQIKGGKNLVVSVIK